MTSCNKTVQIYRMVQSRDTLMYLPAEYRADRFQGFVFFTIWIVCPVSMDGAVLYHTVPRRKAGRQDEKSCKKKQGKQKA